MIIIEKTIVSFLPQKSANKIPKSNPTEAPRSRLYSKTVTLDIF